MSKIGNEKELRAIGGLAMGIVCLLPLLILMAPILILVGVAVYAADRHNRANELQNQ